MLQSVDECLATTSPLIADQIATLKDLHEQLQCKHTLITVLDEKILETLDNDEEIEAEILQTEEVVSSISTAKAKITHHLTPPDTRSEDTPPPTLPPPVSPGHHPAPVSLTRLPKLDLPQFSGNPFLWQPFWDCFEAAVHNNASLTGVQKLSYLSAQLKGEAS